jgi:hypothetical protein
MRGVYARRKGAPRATSKTLFVVAVSPKRALVVFFNGHQVRVKDIDKAMLYWYRKVA